WRRVHRLFARRAAILAEPHTMRVRLVCGSRGWRWGVPDRPGRRCGRDAAGGTIGVRSNTERRPDHHSAGVRDDPRRLADRPADRGRTLRRSGMSESSDAEARKDALAAAVQRQVAGFDGWRVESQTDYQAVLVKGRTPTHVLHLFLTILTLGFWIPVWMFITFMQRRQVLVVTVDRFGNVISE